MSNKNYQPFWDEALKQICEEYKQKGNEDEFNIWFKLDYIEDESNVIKTKVPSEFMRQQIISHGYVEQIKNKLIQLTGQNDFVIEMQISPTISSPQNENTEKQNIKTKESVKKQSETDEEKNYFYYPESKNDENKENKFIHPQLIEKFTFSSFVPGENNNYAYSASLAAAKNPGKSYNPILLYGGVGLGKTHLMQSIGNYIYNAKKGKVKISCISAENFLNEFADSLKNKNMNKFKNKYRNLDVLLLDDIHFLQGKEALQEECFHTFNALSEHNAQMVFTCDRPINELKGLKERLKTRFSSGVCIDLKPPSYENRIAIINKKLELENKKFLPEVIDYIAKNIKMNVRELEASIKKIAGYQELIKEEVTIATAQDLLKDTITEINTNQVSLDVILKVVADMENVSITEIKGKKRTQKIAEARHIAIYIARELLEYSYPELGNEFGGKDHSTILSAYNKIADRIKTEPTFDYKIKEIINSIKDYNKI